MYANSIEFDNAQKQVQIITIIVINMLHWSRQMLLIYFSYFYEWWSHLK